MEEPNAVMSGMARDPEGVHSRLLRHLYRGGRPNGVARFLNRIGAMTASLGLGGGLMNTLEVTGRKSGKAVTFPVVVARVEGERYLVSMLGNDAQWVQNVRASHGSAWFRDRGRIAVQLEELPVDQRAPILKAYLKRAPGARPHIPVDMDAPLTEFEKIAADYPVFRVQEPN